MMERQGLGPYPATLSADAHAIERGGAEANTNAAAANSCKAKKAARMRRNAGGNAEAVLFIPSPIARHGGGNRSGATALLNSCNFLYFCPPPSSRVQAPCNALSSESAHHLKRAAPLSAPLETGFPTERTT